MGRRVRRFASSRGRSPSPVFRPFPQNVALLGIAAPVVMAGVAVAMAAGALLWWSRRAVVPREVGACRAEIARLFGGGREFAAAMAKAEERLAAWKARPDTAALVAPALAEVTKQMRDAHAYAAYGLAHASAAIRTQTCARQIAELEKVFAMCVAFGGWSDASTIELLQRLMRLRGAAGEYEGQVRMLERACREGRPHLPAAIAEQAQRELEYATVLRNAKAKAAARSAAA